MGANETGSINGFDLLGESQCSCKYYLLKFEWECVIKPGITLSSMQCCSMDGDY